MGIAFKPFRFLFLFGSLTAMGQQVLISGAPSTKSPEQIVQYGYLEGFSGKTVGFTLERYPWFTQHRWQSEPAEDAKTTRVIFEGQFSAKKAAEEFHEKNQYKLSVALKAMRLQPTYGLKKEHDDLAFRLHFSVTDDGNFALSGAALLVKEADLQWRVATMDNRATMALFQAIFNRRDPYTALVNGLPFL